MKHIYYNTYADGAQDVSEKVYTCEDGRMCQVPKVKKFDRSLPFPMSGVVEPENQMKTPYLASHLPPTPRPSASPSPNRHGSGVYINGTKVADISKSHSHKRRTSKATEDHREVVDRDPPSPKPSKRAAARPYVVVEQYDNPRPLDIPAPIVNLSDEHLRAPRISRSHDDRDPKTYYRQHTNNAQGYMIVDDAKERRRMDRKARRASVSGYVNDGANADYTFTAPDAPRPPTYAPAPPTPRRSPTIVQHSDGSIASSGHSGSRHSRTHSFASAASSSPPKEVHWVDEVSQKRRMQNDKIANRGNTPAVTELKGILKKDTEQPKDSKPTSGHSRKRSTSTSKSREDPEVARLRHMVERMEIPRSSGLRDRDDEIDRLRSRFETDEQRERRRRGAGLGYDTGYGYL